MILKQQKSKYLLYFYRLSLINIFVEISLNRLFSVISQKTKNEILSKLKNKEKINSNWVNDSSNSGSLSYSKVFKTSGRDYGTIDLSTQLIKCSKYYF